MTKLYDMYNGLGLFKRVHVNTRCRAPIARRELEGRGEIGDAAADATAADDDVLELWKQVAVFREQMPLT